MRKLFILTLAGLLLAGCRKADLLDCGPVPMPATSPPPANAPSFSGTLDSFLLNHAPAFQRRGFLIGQSQPVYLASGSALSLAGVGFLYGNKAVARDSAFLRVREVSRVPDMILSDMPTAEQSGLLLVSGGELELTAATRRGSIYTNPATGRAALPVWQARVPAEQDTSPPQFWQAANPSLGWQLMASNPVQTLAQSPAVSAPVYQVSVPIDSVLRYASIGQVWSAYQGGTLVSFNVAVPAGTDTRVLLRPMGLNGLMRIAATTASGSATTTWYGAIMPLGAPMKAIVLQAANGHLYVGSQLFAVQSGALISPTLTPVSEADALAFIQAQ